MNPHLPQAPQKKPFTSSGLFIALLVGGTLFVSGACGVGMIVVIAIGAGASAAADSDPYAYEDPYQDPYAYEDPFQEPVVAAPAFGGVEEPSVIDPISGTRWSNESAYAMGWYEAVGHCLSLEPMGRWRLPNRNELESLGDPAAVALDRPRPLREPFRSATRADFLWSGEEVPGRVGQSWIMNASNAHVFNGYGYQGHARCVRSGL